MEREGEIAEGAIQDAAGAESFVGSEVFDRTFKEGMALVEETAAYLDGEGRRDARDLDRGAALAYAGESMRLTTRLMQVASWLLVQRAVREGEISREDAAAEKYRLGLKEKGEPIAPQHFEKLPLILRDLLERSERLYGRVSRMDEKLYTDASHSQASGGSEVARQIAALQNAFRSS
ncbi:MAG: DUF1465 family protein [Pseudomonadota bacterium]